MIKYWNPRRLQRIAERKQRHEAAEEKEADETSRRNRTYFAGDGRKNVRLMLDALGLPLRRKMVARLASGGAMSLSKLVDPFDVMLPSAVVQMHILERAGIILTKKQGRTRLCFLRPGIFEELTDLLRLPQVQKYLD